MRPAADFVMREWRVRPHLNRICRGDEARHLEPKAMDLLVFLAREPGRVASKDEIVAAVWEGRIVADSALSRVVADLRRALDDDARRPRYIETIPTRGYRLIAETRRLAGGAEDGERKRIVVLPFQSLGPAAEEYFALGVTEEITTRLAAVGGLAVVSSQSARSPEVGGMTAREIGEALTVDYILEGSVRWDADGDGRRVRISPQLIRAGDDTHLWAESYEGVLDGVFAMQIEIARAVLDQLDVALGERERSLFLADGTANAEAYRAYLRGLSYTLRPDFWSAESFRVIARAYERAADLDPGFAAAHAALAAILAAACWIGLDRSPEVLERSRSALERALELDPELSMAHLARGYLHAARHEHEQAVEALETALRDRPNDSELLRALGTIHRYRGSWRAAVELSARALQLDPRDARLATSLGYTHTLLREYGAAEALYRRSLELLPDQVATYVVLTLNCWLAGDLDGARRTLAAMPAADQPAALIVRWQQALLEGDYGSALARLEASPLELVEDYLHLYPKAHLAGITCRLMGDDEAARRHFAAARELLERRLAGGAEDPRAHGSLGVALGGLGDRQAAIRHARRAVELAPLDRDAVSGPIQIENLAATYVLTGDHDTAVEQLGLLLSIPAPLSAALLRLDPRWQPLREHPRFRELTAG